MSGVIRAALILSALAGSHICGLAAPQSWASFNGFEAGMSKAAAKAAGYAACSQGSDGGINASVYCEIPGGKLTLGGLTAKSGKLEFKPPKHDRVAEIALVFAERPDVVTEALTRVYGAPAGRQGRYAIVWLKDTPESIRINHRLNVGPTTVRFEFDPQLPNRIKAAKAREAADEARKKELLKGF